MSLRSLVASLALLAASAVCHADTLSQYTTNSVSVDSGGFYGQGFTVSGAGAYNNITFSFLSASGSNYAVGKGYIFATPYAGTPTGLSTATDLGTATSSSGVYTFAPSLVLLAGQTYYFYEDAPVALNAFGVDVTTGTLAFYSGNSNDHFAVASHYTYDYRASGTPVASVNPTPEPSSLTLLGTGILGLASLTRKRLSRRSL